MAIFIRRETPPAYSHPGKYKEHLRRDFLRRCAYCERTEPYMGGQEVFEVEHFRPRSKFPDLTSSYSNLYYACRGCNAHKSETWPSAEQATRGHIFADPCEEDPYVSHLSERDDGEVEALTPCAEYTRAHIRLNRKDLREWRRDRDQARKDLPQLQAVVRRLEEWPEREDVSAKLEALRRRIADSEVRFAIE